jgi:hypothetical protein
MAFDSSGSGETVEALLLLDGNRNRLMPLAAPSSSSQEARRRLRP